MQTSVIVGQLSPVEPDCIVIGTSQRILLRDGELPPDIPLGTRLTVVAVALGGVLYAKEIRKTPPAFGA